MGIQVGDIVRNPQEGYYGKIRELVWPDTAVIEPIRVEPWHLKIARHSILELATIQQINATSNNTTLLPEV